MSIAQTIARLVYGGKILELNDRLRSYLEDGFQPPSAQVALNMTGPGGDVVQTQAQNRQWSFRVLLPGSSLTQTNMMVSDINAFLSLARSKADTLYFEFCLTAHIPYRPTYGQAGWHRYDIKYGEARLVDYSASAADLSVVEIVLTIGPYKLGLEQAVLKATGGIYDDKLLSSRKTRGVITLPAITNKFSNPIFGTRYWLDPSSTWTLGASLQKEAVEDKFDLPFGDTCLLVTRTAAAAYDMTQSITAANTNTHVISCYARRKDGGTISATVLKVYYNSSEQTTNFISLPGGWYRIWGSFAGVASAIAAGIRFMAEDISIYVTGFLFEEASYPSPLVYGDLPGCTWAGAYHETASSSTACKLSISTKNLLDANYCDSGTIRIVMRWHYSSTYGTNQYLLDGPVSFYYNATDDKLYMTDGTGSIVSAVQTFAAGDLVVFHLVFGPFGMILYKNGVNITSGSSFTIDATKTVFYLSSTSTATLHSCATVMDLTAWNMIASGSQVLADYTDIYAHITSGSDSLGRSINPIPWWMIASSDEYIYQYQDSTHSDHITVGGISGDISARTKLQLASAAGPCSVLLQLNSYDLPVYQGQEFSNCNGIVWAGALGGEVYQASVNTTGVNFPSSSYDILLYKPLNAYRRRKFYLAASVADAGANLTATPLLIMGALSISDSYKPVAADGTLKRFLFGPLTIPVEVPFIDFMPTLNFFVKFIRTAAGAANVSMDYYRVLFGDVLYLVVSDSNTKTISYDSEVGASGYHLVNSEFNETPVKKGDIIEVKPDAYNYLCVLFGAFGSNASANYFSLNTFEITPRWSLL